MKKIMNIALAIMAIGVSAQARTSKEMSDLTVKHVYTCTQNSKDFIDLEVRAQDVINFRSFLQLDGAITNGKAYFRTDNYFSVTLPSDFLTGKSSGGVISVGGYTNTYEYTCFKAK